MTADAPSIPTGHRLLPWRRMVVLAVIVAALAAVAWTAVWLRDLHPFVIGPDGGAGPAAEHSSRGYVLEYREGKTSYWMVSLRNTSRFDIRIDGLRAGGHDANRLWSVDGLRTLRSPYVVSWRPQDTVPFHAVTLASGASATLVVGVRFSGCSHYASGSSVITNALPVRYTMFGTWHRTMDVAVQPLVVRAPHHCTE